MMISARNRLLILSVFCLPGVGGCSAKHYEENRPAVVPVHGLVLFNGKPLEGARVTFMNPKANEISAYALTDAEGKFTLTTFTEGDGAVPGPQKISVSKVKEPGHTGNKSAPPVFRRGVAAPQARWLIPPMYGNPETSGLTAEVKETGDNDIMLELKGPAS